MPQTIVDHDIIGPDRVLGDLEVARAVLPPGALARMVVRTDSHPVVMAVARAGLGIAVVHQPAGLADPVLLPVLPDYAVRRLPFYIVTHRDLRDVPRVRAAFDHLANEFARYARS